MSTAGDEDDEDIVCLPRNICRGPMAESVMKRLVEEAGIARQLQNTDYDRYDLLIGVDSANVRNILRICGGDVSGKISRLLNHTDRPGDHGILGTLTRPGVMLSADAARC